MDICSARSSAYLRRRCWRRVELRFWLHRAQCTRSSLGKRATCHYPDQLRAISKGTALTLTTAAALAAALAAVALAAALAAAAAAAKLPRRRLLSRDAGHTDLGE